MASERTGSVRGAGTEVSGTARNSRARANDMGSSYLRFLKLPGYLVTCHQVSVIRLVKKNLKEIECCGPVFSSQFTSMIKLLSEYSESTLLALKGRLTERMSLLFLWIVQL